MDKKKFPMIPAFTVMSSQTFCSTSPGWNRNLQLASTLYTVQSFGKRTVCVRASCLPGDDVTARWQPCANWIWRSVPCSHLSSPRGLTIQRWDTGVGGGVSEIRLFEAVKQYHVWEARGEKTQPPRPPVALMMIAYDDDNTVHCVYIYNTALRE